MIIQIIAIAAALAIGFALGRIKNAKKLAALAAVANKVETVATKEVDAAKAKL